jgi:hypothetical protein
MNQLAIAWVIIFGGIYLWELLLSSRAFGIDARIYLEAARAWLTGGDPWAVRLEGIPFGAPPPSLLPVAPLTLLTDLTAARLVAILGLAALAFAILRTKAGWWWLLSVPAIEGVWVGSLDPVALGLLVAAPLSGSSSTGRALAPAIGAISRIYGFVPLALLDRRRAVALGIVILLISAPLLPWAAFLRHLPELGRVFAEETDGGKGVSRVPWLIAPTLLALIAIGRRDGAWLAVPALWPQSQLHYGILALPAASPMFAVVAGLPIDAPFAWAVVAVAAIRAFEGRLDPWSWVPARWRPAQDGPVLATAGP